VDGGLIPGKPGGSLAKEAAEAVPSVLNRWIILGRLRLDLLSEGVRADLTRWIAILRSGLYPPSDLILPAGSEMGGRDSK
jgi:hypothetical protein